MRADENLDAHPEEALTEQALKGRLSLQDQATLKRHLEACDSCAAEIEAARILDASMATTAHDDALDRRAVERALTRLAESPPVSSNFRRFPLRSTIGLATLAVSGAAAVLVGVLVTRRPVLEPGTRGTPAAPMIVPLVLNDGSEIAPDDPNTVIQIGEQTPARTTLRLYSGGARFRVHHDGRRQFHIDAGLYQIEDLGTVFHVVHQSDGRLRVAVSEGRIAVLCTASRLRVELGAGEDRLFSSAVEPSEDRPLSSAVGPQESELGGGAPKPPSPPTARAQAKEAPRSKSSEDANDLLMAADRARRSHQSQVAVPSLRRLIERYPKDPRAPSAAFTLGWVLLTDLNRPRDAAVAFENAERIAPRGTLAEDAAARVAEAWQKAGDARRAAEAARHYAQAYPRGRYIALMHGLIGER